MWLGRSTLTSMHTLFSQLYPSPATKGWDNIERFMLHEQHFCPLMYKCAHSTSLGETVTPVHAF